ncbi:hypothetical protein ABT025_30790 [Streptomyces sp. NPDC002809]|uniref:hypothetical protein n=1 Tax=Streptomyces sp. NPDC002809 TaxID=3154433 RepID=UPI00332D734F
MNTNFRAAVNRQGRRIAIAGIGAVATVGIAAMPAQAASWTSSISGGARGFESHRWSDDGASNNIKFTGCRDDYQNKTVGVTPRKDVTGPDPEYSTAQYTACFGGGTSSGTWTNKGSGDFYFAVNYQYNGVHVWVTKVGVYF